MKILNVRFKNINTLKGEWEIDFDRSPLKEAGLFAITGPNGSGKTTIFDAISLGLYGETVRLKNSPEHIMSKQTSDCYATVTFSVNGNVFRSIWSLHSAAGKPLEPEMRLVELNGTERVLEDNIVTVRSRITELIGLDFKRFFRSIVLAQGEFASLLNALDYERVEILEKIVGPDIYSKTLAEIIKNAETEGKKLTALKEEIQNFPLMHPSRFKALQESVQQLEENFQQAERSLLTLNVKEQRLKLLHQLTANYEENQAGLAEAQSRKEQMQPDLLRLKKAVDAEPFVKDMDQLNRRKEKTSEYSNTLNTLKAEITDLEKRLKALQEKDREQALEAKQVQNTWAERQVLIKKTIEIDQEMETLGALIQTLTGRRSAVKNELKIKVQDQQTTRLQISENDALLANTESWLKEHAADENMVNNIADIKGSLEQLHSNRQGLSAHTVQQKSAQKAEQKASVLLTKATRKLQKLKSKADKPSARQAELKKMQASLLDGTSPETLDKTLNDQKKQRINFQSMLKLCKTYARQEKGDGNALELALKTAEQEHGDLLKRLEQEQKTLAGINNIARFEPCRKQLKKREPCPLCGSTDHPYVDREPTFDKDPSEVVREQEHRIETLKNQIKTLSDQIAELKDRHDRFTETRHQWSVLSRATQTEWALGDRSSIKEAIRALKKEMRRQKGRIKQVRKQAKKMDKLDKALEKKSMKITEKQLVADQLQNDLNRHRQTLTDIQQETQTVRQRETELVQSLRQRLEAFNLAIPAPGTEDKLIRRMENRKIDYLNHVKKQRELNERLLALKNKAAGLPAEIERLKKEVSVADEQVNAEQGALHTLKIKRQKMFGTGDALGEKQETEETLQERQQQLESIQQETQQLRQTLSEKQTLEQTTEKLWRDAQNECQQIEQQSLNAATASGFSSLEELQNSLLDLERRQAIEQKRDAVDGEISRYTADMDTIRKELEARGLKEIAAESSVDLSLQIQNALNQKDQLAAELSAASDRLEHHQTMEKEYQQKLQELEQQEKVCDRINAQKRSFETGEDAEIKMRIRELLIDRLLEHSNRHLGNLTGRYFLRCQKTNGLGLEIEDVLQQKSRRSVNTLSGGESFLVSLSMALGLSDMSGNGRKIQSLFVDEGFGCLDDETLYKVLSTLKDLKNDGKMVGVISHVKKVEDEISTKIRLTRMPGGVSRLDVVA